MTPKQRAKELIEKFENNTSLHLIADVTTTPAEIMKHNKLCALIAIDEIIYIMDSLGTKPIFYLNVKKEIECY